MFCAINVLDTITQMGLQQRFCNFGTWSRFLCPYPCYQGNTVYRSMKKCHNVQEMLRPALTLRAALFEKHFNPFNHLPKRKLPETRSTLGTKIIASQLAAKAWVRKAVRRGMYACIMASKYNPLTSEISTKRIRNQVKRGRGIVPHSNRVVHGLCNNYKPLVS